VINDTGKRTTTSGVMVINIPSFGVTTKKGWRNAFAEGKRV
jgi:hypothetical protein